MFWLSIRCRLPTASAVHGRAAFTSPPPFHSGEASANAAGAAESGKEGAMTLAGTDGHTEHGSATRLLAVLYFMGASSAVQFTTKVRWEKYDCAVGPEAS